jgi:hypothetical protein
MFPIGQSIAFARKDRQRQTLGNYMNYVTHSLQAVKSSDAPAESNSFWYDHFNAEELLLRRTQGKEGNPFMVTRTTRDIIDGHNGIWGEDLKNWMISFLLEVEKNASDFKRGQR